MLKQRHPRSQNSRGRGDSQNASRLARKFPISQSGHRGFEPCPTHDKSLTASRLALQTEVQRNSLVQ